jgi:hypothetical protein
MNLSLELYQGQAGSLVSQYAYNMQKLTVHERRILLD